MSVILISFITLEDSSYFQNKFILGDNTTTSYVTSIPNPPRFSAPGAQRSIPISSLPSIAGGQPLARPTLSGTGIAVSQG